VKLKDFNPITAMENWINSSIDKHIKPATSSTSLAPAQQPGTPAQAEQGNAVNGEPVSGHWIDATGQTALAYSQVHTEDFRRVVNSFDEDRQEWLAWLVSKFYSLLAYLLPPITGVYVGMAIGDAFSGAFTLASAWSTYAHLISVSLELMLPVLGLAVTVQFRRALKDRSQIYMCIVLAALFLVLGVGNAAAQIFLIDQHVTTQSLAGQVGIAFRAFGPMAIDVIATLYLAVIGVRNLKKYLADQREKINAVRDVNQVEIEMEQTQLKASIDKQSAIMDMESKAQRATTWNQIEALQSQAMIDQARRNMLESGEGGSYRRSRY